MEAGYGDWVNKLRQKEIEYSESIIEINHRHNYELELMEDK